MKATINGADGTILCQINSVREGFAALGHTHVPIEDPESAFVFVGNPPFDNYLNFPEKKIIFNILDICWHCKELNDILASLTKNLPKASKVTCISKTVQNDLRKHCGIDAEVIYYPMKPIKFTGERKYPQFKVLMAGRLLDPNKNAGAAVQALIRAGFNESEVAIVGPEFIGWGTRMGEVDDTVLNDLYNSVDYLVCLDRFTGLGLPPVEAACCGAIPIIGSHIQTFDEFWADSPLGLHYKQCTSVHSIGNLIMAIDNNPTWKAEIKQDMMGYANLAFRPKFDPIEVAKRIIGVYESI